MRATGWMLLMLACGGGDDGTTPEDTATEDTATEATPLPCDVLTERSGPEPVLLEGGDNFHPYGFVGDPTIAFDGEQYHMWLTSSSREHTCPGEFFECLTQGFAYAVSDDGLVWDDAFITPEHPDTEYTKLVLAPPDVSWAPEGLETASVLQGPDGQWWMFFTGHQGAPEGSVIPFHDAIGVAHSTDGVNWTAVQTPVFEGASDWETFCLDAACDSVAGGVLEPSVLWNADAEQFEMWYAAFGQPANAFPTYRIGRAVSPDGLSWTRDPEPVLDVGAPGTWDEAVVSHVNVVRSGGRYHMFYHASSLIDIAQCDAPNPPCTAYTPGSVGYATSADGVTWTRSDAPLIDRADAPEHAFFVGGPTAVQRGEAIELTVFGNPDAETAAVFDSHLFQYTLSCP